jgi:hypothetical protein
MIRAQIPVDHAALARHRLAAAEATRQATDRMRQAAGALDEAIREARRSDLAMPGCITTLAASMDSLKDQIDFCDLEENVLRERATQSARMMYLAEADR